MFIKVFISFIFFSNKILLNNKTSVFLKSCNICFYRYTMNKYSIVLISVLFFSTVCAESQTCTSVTTTTCDSGEIPQFTPSAHPGNAVKRGKAGAKGEKGETGPAGPVGTDLSEVVAEVSAATARHGRQIKRNSALLSELSDEISNVESEQHQQNGTVEKLIALVERQSEDIMRLNERVEALTSQLKIIGTFLI